MKVWRNGRIRWVVLVPVVLTALWVMACSRQSPTATQKARERVVMQSKSSGGGDPMSSEHVKEAIFAGGCFWCMEAVFEQLPGVLDVTSGYTGGNVPNPTYEQVSTGRTGHFEAVLVRYDPSPLLHQFCSSPVYSAGEA